MRVFLSAAAVCLTLAAGATAQAWTERHAWPRYRSASALAYDASRERVVLFGGGDLERLADTWLRQRAPVMRWPMIRGAAPFSCSVARPI